MRVAANVVAGLAVLLWTVLFFVGLGLADGVVRRVGYPGGAQIQFYIAFPAEVAMAVLAAAWVFNLLPRWSWLLLTLGLAAVLALPAYLFFYTGGM